MRRLRRITVRLLAALIVLLMVVALAGVLVVRSGWFREKVRARILQELERATGGRAELGQFTFDWQSLTAQVGPLVVHGKEGPTEQPFLRVAAVSVGLRVISAVERNVDLAALLVERPYVRIVVYPDGTTNVPSPAARTGNRNWAEELLRLRVRRYEITNGVFELDQRRTPLNLSGEDLRISMDYEAAGPSYRGEVRSERVRILAAGHGPYEAGLNGTFTLDKDRFTFPKLEVTSAESRAELQGTLEDVRAPRGSFDVKAQISIREAVRNFGLPVGPQGSAAFTGKMLVGFGQRFEFSMNGRMTAQGVGYVRDRLRVENAVVRTDMAMTQDRLTLRDLRVGALGAEITGAAELAQWRRFQMQGQIEGMDLRRAAAIWTDRPIVWSGTLGGPFSLETSLNGTDAIVTTNLAIAPGAEGSPVTGQVDAVYDQAAGTLALVSTSLSTPASRVEVSGTLGQSAREQTLQVRLRTTNLDDLLPGIAMVDNAPPDTLPLKLNNGVTTAEGTVSGSLDDPRFRGQVSVTNGSVEGHGFDRLTAQLDATKTVIQADRIALVRGATEVSGSGTLTARGGNFDDAGVTAALSARGLDVAAIVKELGRDIPISGMANATARVSGSVKAPEAEVTADVAEPRAYGEQLSRLRTTVRYKPDLIEVVSGEATDGVANVRFGGTYRPSSADWRNGEVTVDAATQNLTLARIDRIAKLEPPMDAVLTGRVRGTAQIANGAVALKTINADLAADRVTVNRQAVGTFAIGLETKGTELQVLATGKARESTIEGRGSWTLTGNHPGSGTIRFSRISIASVHELSMLGSGGAHEDDVPFEGFIDGNATINVPLLALRELKGQVTLDAVQINPKPTQALRLGVQPQDVVLKNERPVIVDITPQEIRLRDARFTARDTVLQASGAVPLSGGSNADLAIRGNMNLILLQLLNPDLLARGDANIDASIRGDLQNPNVNGRLTLKGASLYLNDLPNGIDNANGSILIDKQRATIESLTAETGGGTVSLTGLVEFGQELTYRLQANAQQVRVRWPEDLSTTFNARLGLVGTPEASTLSGTITINRAAFNPRTDLGQMLAQASKPVPAPSAPNELLRGLQFEVRVESAPNFTFETSLTRDVDAEVDLNLHGTPLRPVLLGNITVNRGEIQVFGNRYTIDRGEVHFLNPVKIEPSFDMDLETRARGITVNVSFSGTMQQLKVNYSSDPPLQSGEIIALLAMGRDPTSTSNVTASNQSFNAGLVEAGSSLLGQAVNAQISSRLQRFFGASRVKIDPTLTGVDNLPQARLTIEQQVSRNITLTYITNLNRTQEQVVRFQWDLDRNWSAIAVRDPNGFFGIDFQFRKRF